MLLTARSTIDESHEFRARDRHENGKPVSVILPIRKYQEMLERLEDAADVAWLKRARRKKLRFRPLEEVLAE